MEILEYFTLDNQKYWLEQIKKDCHEKILTCMAIIFTAFWGLTACGELPEETPDQTPDQSVPYIAEDEETLASGQLLDDPAAQIEAYVEQRDVWFREKRYADYYYAWSDLNLDGRLELICSWYEGTGNYSRTYIYVLNSDDQVECVMRMEADLGGSLDLLWGLEIYTDALEEGQEPRHFYMRAHDYTPDARYYYDWDMLLVYNADLTEWDTEMIRACTEEYQDVTFSELVDAEYYNHEFEIISQEEWERLEEEFLEKKELIISDLEWDDLWPFAYGVNEETNLSDEELREALTALFFSWQSLQGENRSI